MIFCPTNTASADSQICRSPVLESAFRRQFLHLKYRHGFYFRKLIDCKADLPTGKIYPLPTTLLFGYPRLNFCLFAFLLHQQIRIMSYFYFTTVRVNPRALFCIFKPVPYLIYSASLKDFLYRQIRTQNLFLFYYLTELILGRCSYLLNIHRIYLQRPLRIFSTGRSGSDLF